MDTKYEASNLLAAEWITTQLHSKKIPQEIALSALHILPNYAKHDLFSSNPHAKRNALGNWYEATIYEWLQKSSTLNSSFQVIAKWRDVPKRIRRSPRLTQNGLFYDEQGAIVARGNGQDLGEFDLLVVNGNEIAFVEVIISLVKENELLEELEFKRRLLSAYFSTKVKSCLVSCAPLNSKFISKIQGINGYYAITKSLDDFLSTLKPEVISEPLRVSLTQPYLLTNLKIARFDYLRLHNKIKDGIDAALSLDQIPRIEGTQMLIKRIMLGYLDTYMLEDLLKKVKLTIDSNIIDSTNLRYFPKAVLSVTPPSMRPSLYLRVYNRSVYLKLGPSSADTFEFERNIPRNKTAFYEWLESVDYKANPKTVEKILTKYLAGDNLKKRKKKGQKPEVIGIFPHA